jgi:hypothetical protein
MLRPVWLLGLLLGCRDVPALTDAATGHGGPDAADPIDAPATSDDGDGPIQRRSCVSTFGTALSAEGTFGRLDGYLVAIVPPSSIRGCNADSDHVHLQILMQSHIYDIAVNVTPDVHSTTLDRAPFSAWAEGWHTGSEVYVEYTGLGLHSDTIPLITSKADLVTAIADELGNTIRISVYATTYGTDGAHLVHRNGAGNDGLIVSKPLAGAAHLRAFSFDSQTF